jgi:hypothetical protein
MWSRFQSNMISLLDHKVRFSIFALELCLHSHFRLLVAADAAVGHAPTSVFSLPTPLIEGFTLREVSFSRMMLFFLWRSSRGEP